MQYINFNLPVNEYLKGEILNEEFRKIDENFSKIDENFKTKQEFVCTTTQESTSAPTVNVLKNDYGVSVTPSRVGVGDYNYTLSQPLLTAGKTVPIKEVLIDADGNKITLELISTTVYNIKTANSSDEPTDGILTNQYLSFETYR